MTATDSIRLEHRHLLLGIDSLREAGDHVGELGPEVVDKEVRVALDFLTDHVLPHARREEEVLYPVVARIMGAPEATGTMARDHHEVSLLAGQLARAAEERDAHMMRRILYGLHHVLKLHLAKEEEIYLPLLDAHLSDREGEDLFIRLSEA